MSRRAELDRLIANLEEFKSTSALTAIVERAEYLERLRAAGRLSPRRMLEEILNMRTRVNREILLLQQSVRLIARDYPDGVPPDARVNIAQAEWALRLTLDLERKRRANERQQAPAAEPRPEPIRQCNLCSSCGKRERRFDDLCKRCANELGVRPRGKVA